MAPFFLSAGILLFPAHAEEKVTRSIAVVPIGKISSKTVESVVRDLQKTYDAKIVLTKSLALPKSTYYPERDRYRADLLLGWSESLYLSQTKAILLTSVDISATARGQKDWGVFGLGTLGGRSCVVSSFRLKGSLPNLSKVVIHEVGHTLGLPHCPTYGCVMQDAEGTIRTLETETGKFCSNCQKVVGKWLRQAAK